MISETETPEALAEVMMRVHEQERRSTEQQAIRNGCPAFLIYGTGEVSHCYKPQGHEGVHQVMGSGSWGIQFSA